MRIHKDMDLKLWEDMKKKYDSILKDSLRMESTPQKWFNHNVSNNAKFNDLIDNMNDVGLELQFDEYSGRSLMLYDYDELLPTCIKSINAKLTLIRYNQPLHDGLESINELNIWNYKFDLPQSLMHIDALEIINYVFPINPYIAKNIFFIECDKPFTI